MAKKIMEGSGLSAAHQVKNWLILSYQPVTLFSLRMTHSTSSGGKTLFVPTPYAFKLAMVDAAVRMGGLSWARSVLDIVKYSTIRFRPPRHLVVNQTFIKILKENRSDNNEAQEDDAADQSTKIGEIYGRTINYREFCYFKGILEIAVGWRETQNVPLYEIIKTAAHINYFGKRGSFMQFIKAEQAAVLPKGFSLTIDDEVAMALEYGLSQCLDDLGDIDNKNVFDVINSFSDRKVTLGKNRLLVNHLLPYHKVRSSKNYTFYSVSGDIYEREDNAIHTH